ncbi:MAG: glycosyltransferase [Pseudomonadota bacterium]
MSGGDRQRELEAALAAERERARLLQEECGRLEGELGRLRVTLEEVRRAVRLIFASWSWRLGSRATGLAARVLRRQGPPGGQAWLERLLGLDRDDERRSETLANERRHADAATSADFLVRTDFGLLGPGTAPRPLRVCVDGLPASAFPADCWEAVTVDTVDGLDAIDVVVTATAGDSRLTTAARERGIEIVTWADSEEDNSLRLRRAAAEARLLDPEWTPVLYETAYLAGNPDVRADIEAGRVESATAHWEARGAREFREGWRSYRPHQAPVSLGLRGADDALRAACQAELAGWAEAPRISVLMPVYRVEVRWLEAAIDSVRDQLYPHWELVIVDDASGDPAIDACLDRHGKDERIRVLRLDANTGIAGATNTALAAASGGHVALFDHDDALTIDALWLVARVLQEHDPDIIYSDEAKLTTGDEIVEPHFKPGYSPEMITAQNYVSHLGVYRRSLIDGIGGFRQGYEGAQDHDLLLRALREARSIFHLPRVLYYWRKVPQSTAARFGAKSHAWDAEIAAVDDHLAAIGADATAEKGRFPGTCRVRYRVPGEPRVSVLVPFRDQAALLETCLETLLARTTGADFEVLGIDNQSAEPETDGVMKRFDDDPRVRFVPFDAPFNFAAINNFGAQAVDGEYLLLLNSDMEIRDGHWLEAMLEHATRPDIGAVGARLLYPDGTVQHAGAIPGIGGVAGHSHKYLPGGHPGHFCRPHLVSNVSAVTGACLLVRRSLYLAVGGLDEVNLGVAFNDIDFCLRLLEFGYRNVYTPYAELIHHESKSRGYEDTGEKQARFEAERRYMQQRHRRALSRGDPWYNPNLTLDRENFAVRESWNP